MYGKQATAMNAAQGCAADIQPKKVPEVENAMHDLDHAIDRVTNQATRLCEQLAAVLRPQPPVNECGQPSSPTPVSCPLSDQIYSMSARVTRVAALLEDAHSRLEV
ncbi:MAG: hypothetical protein NUV51_03630 [Sulfuricaulis sp.]|nr:hypothetical protein [Sulfuricaulis sp.]